MNKKYFSYIVLAVVICVFILLRINNRQSKADFKDNVFNRNSGSLVYSKHARCRMDCRQIDESEVKYILKNGSINYSKIENGSKGKSYPLEGVTNDNQHVRIVFAPHGNKIVVVTAIDLDNNYNCDCR